MSANDPNDRRCYENNGVSPANVAIRNDNIVYSERIEASEMPPTNGKTKPVVVLRANGDNTPAGEGYPAGISKRYKIDSYKDTSSFFGRWIMNPENPKRVGSTIATNYYFGPGEFEVGMKPLQDFGATTTIWCVVD